MTETAPEEPAPVALETVPPPKKTRKKSKLSPTAPPAPVVPIPSAAANLAAICRMIDDEKLDPADALTKVMFSNAHKALKENVDEHIAFREFLEGAFETAKKVKAAWEKRRKLFERLMDELDAKLKESLDQYDDVPHVGTIGSLMLHKNPPKVKLAWGDKELTQDLIDMFGIDEKYVRTKIEHTARLDVIARDLKDGVDIPWAELIQESRVEITT